MENTQQLGLVVHVRIDTGRINARQVTVTLKLAYGPIGGGTSRQTSVSLDNTATRSAVDLVMNSSSSMQYQTGAKDRLIRNDRRQR